MKLRDEMSGAAGVPPEVLEQALPDPERMSEVQARLTEQGVKYVLPSWIDLFGLPKTKPVPISAFGELCAGRGPQFAVHSVSMVPELGPADPDQVIIPDLDSVFICPWDRRQAILFADLYMQGSPYDVCPRLTLKRQVRDASDAGYLGKFGIEPEFILMRVKEDGRFVKAYGPDRLEAHLQSPAFGYDTGHSIAGMPFLTQMMDLLEEFEWDLADVVCEGGYSQFELDFGYTDAVAMADRFVFLRLVIKAVARQLGFFATFMPKPTAGDWRSGGHINFSLERIEQPGANAFGNAQDGWSPLAYHAVGGILEHADAITALACPTVNSYAGLVGRVPDLEGGTLTWAPTQATYGMNNRSTMLRLPQTRYAVENRAADMCQNPYLSFALTLGAALNGITTAADPGPPLENSAYDLIESGAAEQRSQRLPRTLLEAIEAFDEDALAEKVLGPTMHAMFSRLKHQEWERFHQSVTDWEVREYLQFF